jgi:uncharacterized protein YoxC
MVAILIILIVLIVFLIIGCQKTDKQLEILMEETECFLKDIDRRLKKIEKERNK